MNTEFEHMANVLVNATDKEKQKFLLQYIKKSKMSKQDLLQYFSKVIDCDDFDYNGMMNDEGEKYE
jgi:hypothetical protein